MCFFDRINHWTQSTLHTIGLSSDHVHGHPTVWFRRGFSFLLCSRDSTFWDICHNLRAVIAFQVSFSRLWAQLTLASISRGPFMTKVIWFSLGQMGGFDLSFCHKSSAMVILLAQVSTLAHLVSTTWFKQHHRLTDQVDLFSPPYINSSTRSLCQSSLRHKVLSAPLLGYKEPNFIDSLLKLDILLSSFLKFFLTRLHLSMLPLRDQFFWIESVQEKAGVRSDIDKLSMDLLLKPPDSISVHRTSLSLWHS